MIRKIPKFTGRVDTEPLIVLESLPDPSEAMHNFQGVVEFVDGDWQYRTLKASPPQKQAGKPLSKHRKASSDG